MLDGLLAGIGQLGQLDDDSYQPDKAIVSTVLTKTSSDTLTVVFLAWHTPMWYQKQLTAKLVKSGTNVLMLDFNAHILNTDIEMVKQSFELIASTVSKEVALLAKMNGYKEISLIGISLGNVALCITAPRLQDFHNVTMIVPGCDMAESVWSGWRTRRLRNAIRSQGVSLTELKKTWRTVAPEWYVNTFQGHSVHVRLSKRDRFIPYRFGRRLADKLIAVEPNTTVSISQLGHIATVVNYLRHF